MAECMDGAAVMHKGPLLTSLFADPRYDVGVCSMETARRLIQTLSSQWVWETLERAGLRGRGGGGFPTGHKWRLVGEKKGVVRYFVCNATRGDALSRKEQLFLELAPERVIEAILCAAFATRATEAYIIVSATCEQQIVILQAALLSLESKYAPLGCWFDIYKLPVHIVTSEAGYVGGEETALLECIEGRPARPRGKPPMPTSSGLFGSPTSVNNLETILQALLILQIGPEMFRQLGSSQSPGTMVFSVTGDIKRPGLYEFPLGMRVRDAIALAGGTIDDAGYAAVFPGGLNASFLGSEEIDTRLDFNSLEETGTTLGTGVLYVLGGGRDILQFARELASAYSQKSCGKCKPCYDGTARVAHMLHNLDRLHESAVDLTPTGNRLSTAALFPILSTSTPRSSYTDTKTGLEKIHHLSEFVKYRGDCHFPVGAMNTIQKFLRTYRSTFEQAMLKKQSIPLHGEKVCCDS